MKTIANVYVRCIFHNDTWHKIQTLIQNNPKYAKFKWNGFMADYHYHFFYILDNKDVSNEKTFGMLGNNDNWLNSMKEISWEQLMEILMDTTETKPRIPAKQAKSIAIHSELSIVFL